MLAQTAKINTPQKHLQCPQELSELAQLMTNDISDYANRVIQKSSIYSHPLDFLPTYIITTSPAEIKPLPLNQSQFTSEIEITPEDAQQIFFTSLERQYPNNKTMIETQNYHWLIMTLTHEGWNLAMAFTKFGYPRQDKIIVSPPHDTTYGIIGQAVSLWLKDCRSGTLKSL